MKRSPQIPHTYVIVFAIIFLAAILTWIIPGGQFSRQLIRTSDGTREVIDAHSFQWIDHEPQTWQIFSAFYKGFIRTPHIIVFILILGGAFWLLNESKAVDVGVYSFLGKAEKFNRYKFFRKIGVNNLIITVVMLIFSLFGAIFGMSEETIAFVIIFVPMAISMGYDSIVGVSMCFIGAGIGFAGCLMNPFTLGIAQEIAGLPLFSGIEYRFFIWIVVNIFGIGFILWYANRVKRNPRFSPVYENDHYWREQHANRQNLSLTSADKSTYLAYFLILAAALVSAIILPMNQIRLGSTSFRFPALPLAALLFAFFGRVSLKKSREYFMLNILGFTILYLIIGVTGFSWGLLELATLFFSMAVVIGIGLGKTPNQITQSFIAGAKDILSAALVVALAGGIIVILEDGKIIDTILYSISNSIQGAGKISSLSLMYLFQSGMNAIITSGTAKAALLMPILRDVSDMIGLSQQATVTAFHIGDGFTNLITPTSGVLIGVLEVARIPFVKWFKWAWKFILMMVIIGWLLLIPTVTIPLNGF